jgi:chaperonin GroEL
MPNMFVDVKLGAKARKKVLAGVNAVYDAVRLTLGPAGRNALLPRTYNRGPRITNDGVTISEHARLLKDDHERLAAEAFHEGSKKTNELAGDGTTTTAVIGGYLINETFRKIADSDLPSIEINTGKEVKDKGVRALRRDMLAAKDLVIEEVKKLAKPIKTLADLEKIATISIGIEDESTAKTVAKMVWDVARDSNGDYVENHIEVTEGFKGEVETEVIKGMRYPCKVAHRSFVTNPERYTMECNDVPVLITNYKLDNAIQVAGLLSMLKQAKVAIFAPEFSGNVLTTLLKASEKGMLFYPIKCPALRTSQMEDIAVYTGATVIDKESGRKLENVTVEDLGFAEKILVKDTENREDAVIIGGKGEKIKRGDKTLIEERAEMLKSQYKEARNDIDKKQLEKRIANLSSAIGVIRVGTSTSAEGLFLKLKIEDGVYACKAALQEGYVKGGGLCLKEIAEKMPENILSNALKAPYEQIQKNAGGHLEIGKEVIDPAKVVRLEVEHGVSVAATLITTEIVAPELREKGPAEGYEEVANAIRYFAGWYAKHHGMLKASEDSAQEDLERRSLELAEHDNG